MKYINDTSDIKIYWDDMLESYLWEYPQLPPWRVDKDFKNQLVPIIYKLFSQNVEYIQYKTKWTPCFVQPDMVYKYDNKEIYECFLKLMHEIIDRMEEVFLCVGHENEKSTFIFSCDCHDNFIKPAVIKNENDFIELIDIENKYWPNNKDDLEKFRIAVELTKQRLFNGKNFKNEYVFSNSFLRDMISVKKYRFQILKQIAKRLTLSSQEASADSSLKNEYCEEKKEYRIRVTQRPSSTRIHYVYTKNGEIEFLNFYDEGHHDDAI